MMIKKNWQVVSVLGLALGLAVTHAFAYTGQELASEAKVSIEHLSAHSPC